MVEQIIKSYDDGTPNIVALIDGNSERCISYYENGDIEHDEYFLNGLSHGVHTWKSRTGVVLSREEWNEGDLHGVYHTRWYNGNSRDIDNYANGKYNGECMSHDVSGAIVGHVYYCMDLVIIDLLKNPVYDFEKFELQLAYGGKWL